MAECDINLTVEKEKQAHMSKCSVVGFLLLSALSSFVCCLLPLLVVLPLSFGAWDARPRVCVGTACKNAHKASFDRQLAVLGLLGRLGGFCGGCRRGRWKGRADARQVAAARQKQAWTFVRLLLARASSAYLKRL